MDTTNQRSEKAFMPGGALAGADGISLPGTRHEADLSSKQSSAGSSAPHAGHLKLRRTFVFWAQLVADFGAMVLTVVIAGLLARLISTNLLHISYKAFDAEDLNRRISIWLILIAALCAWFGLTGTYTARKPLQDDLKQTIGALIVVLMIDGFVQFATREVFSRLWIFLVWPLAVIAIPMARISVRRFLDRLGVWRVGAAVLGNGEHYASVESSLMDDTYVGYYVAYHADLTSSTNETLSAMATKLAADMRVRRAETVIIVPNDQEIGNVGRIMDALNLNLTPYVLIPPIKRLPFSGLTVQSIINSDAILMTSRTGLLSPIRQAAKRGFDIIVGIFMLILFAPLFAVLSVLIICSGGSPIYGHKRIGRGGQAFLCLKFRTMAQNADKILADIIANDPEIAREWRQNFKLDNDPRVTKVGRFLRKTSLDELPQLINVIRGQMSLVGPRPVVAEELVRYYGDDAFYYRLVRPGITGLWQVNGRSQTSYERRVFLDAWYVRNWNLWTDLVILFNTIPTAVLGFGAK